MPALKMKTKSTTDSPKGKDGLHVCRMSSTISKNSLSHRRVVQNAEVCSLFNQDTSDDKTHALNLGGDACHDESHNEINLSQKHPSTLTDSTTAGNVDPTLSTGTSSLQTNFPLILDLMDFCNNEGNGSLYVPELDTDESDDDSRSLSEYQACNVSDFYISDMIFSAPSTRCNSGFENNTNAGVLPDYKCEESTFLCDLTEECMVLPSLEDTLDTRSEISDRPSEEKGVDVDSFSLFAALRQLRSHNDDSFENAYSDQDYESFDLQMYIRNPLDQLDISFASSTPMPNEKQSTKQVTLVLDLDETLVHSTLDHCDDADFTFPVFFDMKEHVVYVKKRPHLQTFLKRVAEMFEVVVFTASQSIYAKQLLDILDPEGNIISSRAYRESCIFSEGIYVKDLTVLGVDLAKVAIIDNTPQVFQLQVNNGIPIKSWFDDPSDSALISLLPFLETLVNAYDVRPIIARKFGNKE